MKNKIRIKLNSFNYDSLLFSTNKIITSLKNLNYLNNSIKIISLPTSKRIYCVLRSPHVDKNSREHFEIRTYKKSIDLFYKGDFFYLEDIKPLGLSSDVFCSIILF